MKSFEYVITVSEGLDAQLAGMLCKEAVKYKSVIMVHRGEKAVNAKSMLLLLTLGIKCGDAVKITAEGEDEAAAASAIEAFFKANLRA